MHNMYCMYMYAKHIYTYMYMAPTLRGVSITCAVVALCKHNLYVSDLSSRVAAFLGASREGACQAGASHGPSWAGAACPGEASDLHTQ